MVFEKVREILCDQLDLEEDKVTMDSDIVEDFEADSLEMCIRDRATSGKARAAPRANRAAITILPAPAGRRCASSAASGSAFRGR